MGELAVLDRSGDTKLIWSAENDEEVEAAKKMFNDLKAKGYAAYSVNKKGDKGDVIKKFDPEVERIIMAPAMVGG
jgi:hypothetical protein